MKYFSECVNDAIPVPKWGFMTYLDGLLFFWAATTAWMTRKVRGFPGMAKIIRSDLVVVPSIEYLQEQYLSQIGNRLGGSIVHILKSISLVSLSGLLIGVLAAVLDIMSKEIGSIYLKFSSYGVLFLFSAGLVFSVLTDLRRVLFSDVRNHFLVTYAMTKWAAKGVSPEWMDELFFRLSKSVFRAKVVYPNGIKGERGNIILHTKIFEDITCTPIQKIREK